MSKTSDTPCCRLDLVFAALILRLWVGMRLFFAGLEKFRDPDWLEGKQRYGFEYAEGGMEPIKNLIMDNTILPKFSVEAFAATLPYALVLIGLVILIGIGRQFALLAGGLLLLGLSLGMMLLPDDDYAVMIGIQVAITGFALMLSKHDKISLDGVIGLATGGGSNQKDSE